MKIKFLIIPAIVVLALLAVFSYNSSKKPKEEDFIIKKGENILQVCAHLEQEGLVKNRFRFVFKIIFSGLRKDIKAGKYSFTYPINENEILASITKGEISQTLITIIPGWSINEIASLLQKKGAYSKSGALKFFLGTTSPEIIAQQESIASSFQCLEDRPKEAGFEGYLFPDTYQLEPSLAIEEIAGMMLANFDQKLTVDLREKIKKSKRTIFETIIMASILEKEVPDKQDKKVVAGILWKRLDSGIMLEVDSTLNYFLASHNETIESNPLLKQNKTRYNTYKYAGLPPTPIGNPSLENIEAAIFFEETDYWFYLTTKEGEVVYAKSFGEHLINKAKYLY